MSVSTAPPVAIALSRSEVKRHVDRDQLQARLRGLARDERFAPRADDLNDLADALASPASGFGGWEDVDLLAAFPPSSSVRVPRPVVRDRLLAAIAGVAIFIPVAWTWFSLRQATQLYQEVGLQDPYADKSFLYLWANGFSDGAEPLLASWHRLPAVAVISVVVIGVASLAVVAQRLIADRDVDKAMERQADAEATLASTLTHVRRHIRTSLTAGDGSIEALVRRSTEMLREAHEHTTLAAHALRQTSDEVGQSLTAASVTVTGAVEALDGTAVRLTDAATAARDAALAAEATAAKTAEGVDQALADSVDRYSTVTRNHVTALQAESEAAAQRLHHANAASVQSAMDGAFRVSDAVQKSATTMSAEVAALVAQVEAVARTMREASTAMHDLPDDVAAHLKASVTAVSSAAKDFDRNAEHMTAVLERIDDSLVANQSAVQAQTSELTRTRDAIQQLRSRS